MSGRPTIENRGIPNDTSTSTSTGQASTPNTAAVRKRASMAPGVAARSGAHIERHISMTYQTTTQILRAARSPSTHTSARQTRQGRQGGQGRLEADNTKLF